MGHGIVPEPPVFRTGLPGQWVQYTNEGPFPTGVKCRPARVIDMGFVGAWQQASDAEHVSDFYSQVDEVPHARTVATCALMGLLSVGTAKGYVASDNHSELTRAKAHVNSNNNDDDDDDDGLAKLKRKLNGRIKTYTYCPNANDADVHKRSQTAMMFCYVHIEMHDKAGKYVGFKILMLIFDKGFSTDLLASKVMEENALLKASGQINGMPEDQRQSKMERQNKLQRTLISDDNLEVTAVMQSRRICTNQDYIKFVESVGGHTSGREGRPYYADIMTDTPPGCTTNPFAKDDEFGGLHPFGPSVSHNHKRHKLPTDDHPGVNVSIAGTLDARGVPIDLHESLTDPRLWYDPVTHDFEPPQHVRDNGWCHMCHDPSVTNIFNARLPRKMHGNIEPEEILLRQYWELYKDTSPILKKAQQKGMVTFEENRDRVLALFHREDDIDPDQQRLSRAILETELLSADSIDKSAAEEATIERRAYGKPSQSKESGVMVFSVKQVLLDESISQETVHSNVNEYDKKWRAKNRSNNYNAQQAQYQVYNRREQTVKRQAEHAEATAATIKLGLQRFDHAYSRKKARKYIPPGYYDIAHVGLKNAVREAGEIAARRSARDRGICVDPEDSSVAVGTANIGFGHSQSLVAVDLTPFGHYRMFLMHLFSGVLRIAGGDVKLMLDMHAHAFEPFQEVSYFLLLCGGAGSGKSMRAKRMQALLPDGWVKGSGSSSAKAGMNGGMDYLCGRLVYYDEIPNDFASNDSERIEYLKSITMEQRVLNTRSVKTVGESGMEEWTTVVLDSLHYESHLICTNCGPLGMKGDAEPSTNRTALTDRSWAHIVHSAEDNDDSGDVDFDLKSASEDVKGKVNKYRVCACLVAYVLIYIKNMPSCRPNLTYANLLTNKWYDILWIEYNIQKPTKRKRIKLRMLIELFATESAVFEKFMMRESGVDFADMCPGEDGYLSPFCIEQLKDVVCSLQRCVDWEVIHNAWSHSLDHSPITSAHRFQMMTELTGMHGTDLDWARLTGDGDSTAAKTTTAPSNAPQAQGRPEEEMEGGYDAAALANSETTHAKNFSVRASFTGADEEFCAPLGGSVATPPPPSTEDLSDTALCEAEDRRERNVPAPATAGTPTEAAVAVDVMSVVNRERGAGVQHQAPRPPPTNYDHDPPQAPRNEHGHTNVPTATIRHMMTEEISRETCAERASELGERRELRCEMSNRGLVRKLTSDGMNQHEQLTKIFTDKVDEGNERLLHLQSANKFVSASRAAGACIPDVQDVLNSGMEAQFVKDIVSGKPSDAFGSDNARTGVKGVGLWEFEIRPTEAAMKAPADYDFNWAILKSFKQGGRGGADAAPGSSGGQKQKSVWSNSAREIKKAMTNLTHTYSLMKSKSMTVESMRDTLFQMGQMLGENKIRIPRHNSSNFERLNYESCMLSGTEKFNDATKPPAKVHPHCMLVNVNGKLNYHPGFASPQVLARPLNSTVGESGNEMRLVHLVNNRALPSCILPDSFERGVPLKECDSNNGIYFNKHTASEHAALVLESALFMANVPGIAGGNYTDVPGSFKVHNSKQPNTNAMHAHEMEVEITRNEVNARNRKRPAAASDQECEDPSKRRRVGEEDDQVYEEEDQEEDQDDNFAEDDNHNPMPSPLVENEASSSDLGSVQHSVTHPDSEELGVRPKKGASAKAAGATASPSSKQGALPFLWDQGAIFFSIKMTETLHNDCHEYVETVRAMFPQVYEGEDCDETLKKLPHISLRFPGTKEKDKNLLQPLSCSIPLKESRFCDVARNTAKTRASKAMTEAVHSIANGRAVAFNDPAVLEYEAEARGVNSGFVMEGNLFARSTWQRFTLSALDARGMRTPEEERRVNDQGLCMSLRVRNHLAACGEDVRGVSFGDCTPAVPITFAAHEREKRKRALDDEDSSVDMESAAARSHQMENESNREDLETARKQIFVV